MGSGESRIFLSVLMCIDCMGDVISRRSVERSVEDVERNFGTNRENILGVSPLELDRVRDVVGIRDLTGEVRDGDKLLPSVLIVDVHLL